MSINNNLTFSIDENKKALLQSKRFLLIASREHQEISSLLVDGAYERCMFYGLSDEQIDVIYVSDIQTILPAIAALFSNSDEDDEGYAGVLAMGCALSTNYGASFKTIIHEVSNGLLNLSIMHIKPVINEFLFVDDITLSHERHDRGAEGLDIMLEMALFVEANIGE